MIKRIFIFAIACGSVLASPIFADNAQINHFEAAAPVPGVMDFSDFFALMPSDNLILEANSPVLFPQNGASNGTIARLNDSSFLLPAVGTYQVQFNVSVEGPGQLMLRLNGAPVASSVVGKEGGTGLVGISLMATTSPNSVLEVVNPAGNNAALISGAENSVAARLVIQRIQ